MGLPWKRDEDLNVSSNEYTTKLALNRCFDRLLDNDIYLWGILNAGINRSTGLRFASREQISELDPVSGAISPAYAMSLSANYSETLTGVTTDDKFITPSVLNEVFRNNELLPKITYIDIIYRGVMHSIKQIVDSAISEISNFVLLEDTTVYVRFLWHDVTEDAIDISDLIYSRVDNSLYTGKLQGSNDRFMTFKINGGGESWTFIRERQSYALTSREQATGYNSLF